MSSDVEKMYLDLTKLLEDICNFLTPDKLGNMSAKNQHLANSLIMRSKKQLQDIAKIQCDNCNNENVKMRNQDIKEEAVSRVSFCPSNVKPEVDIFQDDSYNPYAGLPAKSASNEIKCGLISMSQKLIFGLEKIKRSYASIHNGWLLVYKSEKDMKPYYSFNLNHYQAMELDEEKCSFSLVSENRKEKPYHFIALTRKDMLQWTVGINKKSFFETGTMNETISDDQSKRKYNGGNEDQCSTDEDEAVYEQLTTMRRPELQHKGTINTNTKLSMAVEIPLKLSPRVAKTTLVSYSSSTSLISYHEISNFRPSLSDKCSSNSTKSLEHSFSEESDDSTYNAFSNIKNSRKSNNFNSNIKK